MQAVAGALSQLANSSCSLCPVVTSLPPRAKVAVAEGCDNRHAPGRGKLLESASRARVSPFVQRLAINVNTQPSGQNAVFGWSFLMLTSVKPARSSSRTISFGK